MTSLLSALSVDTRRLAELRKQAERDTIRHVRLLFADASGVSIGKTVPVGKFFEHAPQGFHIARSGLVQDIEGMNAPVPGFTTDAGDSDFLAIPDLETFQRMPYRPGMAQVLLLPTQADGTILPESSEGVLRKVLVRCAETGYTIKAAVEIEFYLMKPGFEPAEVGLHAYRHAALHRLGPVVDALVDQTQFLGLEVEGWLHEYAPGQVEINFAPSDPLTMARKTFLFKQMVREVALLHGYEANFLAKPLADHSGSGTHVHLSLWQDGQNVFFAPESTGASVSLMQFVAGQIAHSADLFLLYASNINSFRRLGLGEYMPTSASWGYDDRTVAFRLLTESAKAARLEHRIAGADTNPYLLLAGILAAGMAGILGQYPAPATATQGQALARFPAFVPETLECFAQSAFAREWLGGSFVDLLTILKTQEWRKALAQITDWERAAYGPVV